MLLDQGNLGAKSRRTGRRHQSSRPRADDNEIISGRRGRVLPIGRVKIGNEAPILDRKSTRLNSSHVAISYAVFCLKKKKKETKKRKHNKNKEHSKRKKHPREYP